VHDPTEFDVDTARAAQFLGVVPKQLSQKRYATLPRLIRGRKAYYRRADLLTFLGAQVRTPAAATNLPRRRTTAATPTA
jgi:hypothetical protein